MRGLWQATIRSMKGTKREPRMASDYQLLTLSEVEQAAQVIAQAFVDDPFCSFMLPRSRTRVKTLLKFFRAFGEAGEPHFYLDNMGVVPSAQGQGLSSKLIRPFLEIADAQRVIMYTETVTRSNVPRYEHFGFQCVEESAIAGTGITVWALRRPRVG